MQLLVLKSYNMALQVTARACFVLKGCCKIENLKDTKIILYQKEPRKLMKIMQVMPPV